MSKAKIKQLIEKAIESNKVSISFLNMGRAFTLKGKLDKCDTAGEVVQVLQENADTIKNIFKVSESTLDKLIEDIKNVG